MIGVGPGRFEDVAKGSEIVLGKKVRGARFEGGMAKVGRGVLSKDDDLGPGIELPDTPGGFEAVQHGHLDIHQDPVGMVGGKGLQRCGPITALEDVAVFLGKETPDQLPEGSMIVHEQKARGGG